MSDLRPKAGAPRVLLTTPPGEAHSLGLLGLQASLALTGAHCISLGLQTPASSVASAAIEWDIAIVCISASVCNAKKSLRNYVTVFQTLAQATQECKLLVPT